MYKKSHKIGFAAYLFQMFQVFSLDVVTGALAVGVFAVKLLQVRPNPWWWPVLALSVWVVYTADHLIDGYSKKHKAVILRHRIHYRYRYFFIAVLFVAAVVTLILVWTFMDRRILKGGMVLGIGALAYLVLILLARKKGFYFQKEFFISLFYVAGIWLAPIIWYDRPLSFFLIMTILVFIFLAWSEGLLMAVFEQQEDKADKMDSFCTFYGVATTRRLSGFLLTIAIIFSLTLVYSVPIFKTGFILLTGMAASLMVLLLFTNYFQINGRYRLLGELTFWFPFLLVL